MKISRKEENLLTLSKGIKKHQGLQCNTFLKNSQVLVQQLTNTSSTKINNFSVRLQGVSEAGSVETFKARNRLFWIGPEKASS